MSDDLKYLPDLTRHVTYSRHMEVIMSPAVYRKIARMAGWTDEKIEAELEWMRRVLEEEEPLDL